MAEENEKEVEIDVSGELAEVEINLDDKSGEEGAKTAASEAKSAPEPAKSAPQLSEGAEELRRQAENERQRRLNAERELQNERGRNAQLTTASADAHLIAINEAVNAAQVASAQAKAEYQGYLERGAYKEAADAQEKIADARANLLRLHERKAEWEAARNAPPPQQQRQQVSQPQMSALDQVVDQLARTGAVNSAAWVKNHPEVLKEGTWERVQAADQQARILEGKKPDSPEYLARVEEILGMRTPKSSSRSAPTIGAPVTRNDTSVSTGEPRRGTITLSPKERAFAKEMGMTDKQYALRKAEAIEAGEIGVRH